MYLQPYGDEQQLNLNWIINEIINLHKQLDPDYETPSFTQVYPYSNLNRLNLDWVLSELKALKELAPEPTPEIDIQAVAEALVALPFDSNTSYQIYDFISKDGEIWRATEAIAAGGVWDETKWFKTKIGTDLAVLERWINAINNSLTSLQNTVADLSSIDISDDSDAGGATVKASLNNLKGSINDNAETYLVADTTWEQGSISGTGAETVSTTRIRTKNYIPVTKAESVSGVVDSGYMFSVSWYNSSKTFLSESEWRNTAAKVDKPTGAAFCRILLALTNNDPITPDASVHIEVRLDMTVKNAIDTVNDKTKYDIYDEGIYAYNNPILAAYTTASGNYIDFFMPIKVNPELTLTATYAQSYRHEGDTSDSHTVAYLLDARIDATVAMNANITILKKTESGITFEIGFTNTQTPAKPATICVARLVITATR